MGDILDMAFPLIKYKNTRFAINIKLGDPAVGMNLLKS